MLRKHPQVHMSRTKELHFFDRHFDRGLEWYAEQFEPRRRHKQVGETTPAYMYKPRARKRLIAQLPDARIVMILRNPVDRAYSHYWHDLRRLEQERHSRPVPQTFEAAILQEQPALLGAAQPEAGSAAVASRRDSYVGRGEYIDQIRPFVRAYGRDRVHVMLLDDLIADRTASLRALLAFLRVSERPAEDIQEVHANRYRRPDEQGKVKPAEYVPMQQATRAALAEHYQPYNERLATWLGRDLSHWR
jgi:hypothetical protein